MSRSNKEPLHLRQVKAILRKEKYPPTDTEVLRETEQIVENNTRLKPRGPIDKIGSYLMRMIYRTND